MAPGSDPHSRGDVIREVGQSEGGGLLGCQALRCCWLNLTEIRSYLICAFSVDEGCETGKAEEDHALFVDVDCVVTEASRPPRSPSGLELDAKKHCAREPSSKEARGLLKFWRCAFKSMAWSLS